MVLVKELHQQYERRTNTIWAGYRGYKSNNSDALQIQGCRNHQWGSSHRSCASVCEYPAQNKRIEFLGYLKGKSTLMIYDRHPEKQSKWNKAFWARGYYVANSRERNRKCNQEIYQRTERGITKGRLESRFIAEPTTGLQHPPF